MYMKRILILGSKPKAIFDNFDVAYCANAASSFYESRLSQGSGVVKSIISASELVGNKRIGNADKTNWLENKLPMLVDNSKSKIFLINHNHFPAAVSIVNKSSFLGECELINSRELALIQDKVTSLREPIWTKFHRKVPFTEFLRNIKGFITDNIKYLTIDSHQISGLFRPSTGVISLIKAIDENGYLARYEVSGIGIKSRGFYADGAVNTWTPKSKLEAYHVYVDRLICEVLAERYSITFSDESMTYLNSKDCN